MRAIRPDYFYTIYFAENDVNNKSDIEIMKHENSLNKTISALERQNNTYVFRSDAVKAKELVWLALRKKRGNH